MRVALLWLLLGAAWIVGLLYAVPADAHPLGNFSVNHLSELSVSQRAVDVRYTLDQAEIPTFQERRIGDAAILARKRAEVARRLVLTVDGRRVTLAPLAGARISHPPGQGGLALTRVVLSLRAAVAGGPRAVSLRDGTFPGRVGWVAIVARRGLGTAVRSDVPSADPTRGLRSYPSDKLSSPLHEREARLSVRPGDGTLVAPRSPFGDDVATTRNRAGDGLAGLFSQAADGRGVLLLLLLAAFGWGAVHALSPGHGKTMVAAYLVGTRGTARHAVALGAVTTVTHTIGVFALALVTLVLSQYVLPEQLYPWLTLASGLLVMGIGLAVLRSRARTLRASEAHHHHHHHHHDGDDHHHADHDHGHEHAHHHHGHGHGHAHGHAHHHHMPEDLSWRGLVALGASAGLIPCPSALVVLLGAISQHEVGLGLAFVTAFSLGLAATLTALGLVVVYASRMSKRLRGRVSGRLAEALPALSAVIIVGVGLMLTMRALPGVLGA
jgi:nickel/cobalt exporter